jgi:hypothetical protein
MSQDKEKAPELGGEGSVLKEASPAKATGTASTNSAKNASTEVSFNSKVPDAEKEFIGYLLNFPDDIDSFNKLKREHFGHPKCRTVFNVIQEFRTEGKSVEFDEVAPAVIERERKIKPGELSEWLSLGDSNTFPMYFGELERRAEDRANGGVRYYFKDVQSSSSETKFIQKCPYPTDSIIHEFVEQGRLVAESSDSMIVGCVVGVIAGLLGRNIWYDFGSKKYPNVYAILSARPGERKSTIINLVEDLASDVLFNNTGQHFLCDANSVQSLFDEFHDNPDRVWIIDDGNPTLHEWATSIQGAGVSKQFLRSYDCKGMSENYRRNRSEDNESGKRTIEGTSLSLIMGCTFSALRDHRIQAKDGLKRRFLNYTSSGPARTIYEPVRPDEAVWKHLVEKFRTLRELRGQVTMSQDAKPTWREFQDANRKRIADTESEELASLLSEEPSHVLKIAMIFQAARHVVYDVPFNVISKETLELAIDHVRGCVDASESIESANSSEALEEIEDFVYCEVNEPLNSYTRLLGTDAILVTKSELTRRFSRQGNKSKIRTDDLYRKAIPSLIKKGLCAVHAKEGKKVTYRFKDENVK